MFRLANQSGIARSINPLALQRPMNLSQRIQNLVPGLAGLYGLHQYAKNKSEDVSENALLSKYAN